MTIKYTIQHVRPRSAVKGLYILKPENKYITAQIMEYSYI